MNNSERLIRQILKDNISFLREKKIKRKLSTLCYQQLSKRDNVFVHCNHSVTCETPDTIAEFCC